MTHNQFIASIAPMHDDMFRLAAAITGTPEDAADAVQDTMLKLWKAREAIPPDPDKRAAYCFTALRRRCFSIMTAKKPSDSFPDADLRSPDSTDALLMLGDSQQLLLRIIDSLPESQRVVIRLTTIEGCDISRTAMLTGLSPSNVRQLISRARRQIKEKFNLLNK